MANDSPGIGRLQYLKKRFSAYGIFPNRSLGQNFLLDRNAALAICRDAELYPLDTVMEVGPGSGLLSTVIAETGAALLAIEFDRKLFRLVTEELRDFQDAEVIEGDILASKRKINPEALARIRTLMEKREAKSLKCVSNLPYCIASPFIANLCSNDLPWSRGVFMVQLEEAKRISAKSGAQPYGKLSVVAQLACSNIHIARTLPPQVFWPRPRVQSAVLVMDFKPLAERMALPWEQLNKVVQAAFTSRRKKLSNSMQIFFKNTEDFKVEELLKSVEIDPGRRGESLSPAEILTIAQEIQRIFLEKK